MEKPNLKTYNAYLKYSGMAFQMFAMIGLCVWAGLELDAYLALEFPIFTLILSLLGTIGAMVVMIKSLPKVE